MHHSKSKTRGMAVLIGAMALTMTAWAKLSLGVRFPDIVLEKTEPGAVYNLRELKGLPYVVVNQSDQPVEIDLVVEAPSEKQAKEGYEPIADPSWIRMVPNAFKLAPGDLGTADVILAIPTDAKYQGKHYHAYLRARTRGTGFLGLAVLSEVRFSIGSMGPDALKKEKQANGLLSFDMDMTPQTIRLAEIPVAKAVDLKADKGVSLKITNRGDKAVKLKLESVALTNQQSQPGYLNTPHPEWLTVKPGAITVKGNTIAEAKLTLKIPDAPENKGQKFLFLIKAAVQGLESAVEMRSFVYVQTQ